MPEPTSFGASCNLLARAAKRAGTMLSASINYLCSLMPPHSTSAFEASDMRRTYITLYYCVSRAPICMVQIEESPELKCFRGVYRSRLFRTPLLVPREQEYQQRGVLINQSRGSLFSFCIIGVI